MIKQVTVRGFFTVNESKLRLTLPTGAIIQFKSAEKPDNLYGDDVYACVFDEFTRAREEAWFALRSTLTATNGKCKLIGNAKGKKNWGYRLGLKAKSGEQDYEYHKITAWHAVEAGILKQEEIEQAQRDLPDHVFRELYLAEPSDDGSNPFGLNYIKMCIAPIQTDQAVCYGIDLAKSVDYTVIIGLNSMGLICFFERFRMDWGNTTKRIREVIGKVQAQIDSTGVGDPIVEDLQNTGCNVIGFKYNANSKQELMLGLANALQNGRTSVIQGIHQDELEAFEYVYSLNGVKYSAPQGMHDDTVNAHALAWQLFLRRGTGNYNIV
jgi:phage FluMu gp28-like protein